MNERMNGLIKLMNKQTTERTNEWMNLWKNMNGLIKLMNKQTNEWMNERMNGLIKLMNKQTNERMNKWIYEQTWMDELN